MVSVRIYKTKMFIEGGDPELMAQVVGLIGTAKIEDDNPSAADPETRGAIQRLKENENQWVIQAEHMRAAKAGREEDLGYEFNFTPYAHQRRGFYFMHAGPRSAIFGDCGIGKTAIAASFLDSLKERGELDAPALIVCPISIIQHAWIADLKKFTKHLKFISIYEPSSYKRVQKRKARLETEADVYITSFSLLRIMETELRKKRFGTVIVDESTKIKNPQSKTFRALKQVSWKAGRRYVMSGTPAPNGPLDLWSQFFFVDGGMTLEPSIVDFRHE
ncbi:MAG: SNF2-related protein, partial [Planctomycetota bacterium]